MRSASPSAVTDRSSTSSLQSRSCSNRRAARVSRPSGGHLLQLIFFAVLIAGALYLRSVLRGEKEPPAQLTEDEIRQKWRKLGFFCELDDEKKLWVLTGSRAGLLYFPDLLLGYVADPDNAANGSKSHFGPYGSLEIMTYPEPGFDAHAIRGSLDDLTRLAEVVGEKLASAQPGETVRIHDEFAAASPYSLLLDVRVDGFDPATTDREHLGTTTTVNPRPAGPDTKSGG